MTNGARQRWKELEVARRLPLGRAAHPDDCLALTIKGVDWALPPRGIRVVPRFRDGGAALEVLDGPNCLQATRLVEAVRRLKRDRRCRCCGRVTESVVNAAATDAGLEVLEAAASLAARALRGQYHLNDAELSELLSFDSSMPPGWTVQIIRWAMGLDTAAPRAPDEAPPKPRWWAFWRRWK